MLSPIRIFLGGMGIFLGLMQSSAQQYISLHPIKLEQSEGISSIWMKPQLYSIDVSELFHSVNERSTDNTIHIKLPDYEKAFDIVPHEIRSDNYLLRTASGFQRTAPYVKTFKGISLDGVDEFRMTLDSQFIEVVFTQGDNLYYIEQARHYNSRYVSDAIIFYKDTEQPVELLKCGVKETGNHNLQRRGTDSCNIFSCINISSAIANDYLTYERKNSDVNEVENFNLSVLNTVQMLYDDEFDEEINLTISEIFISDCPTCDIWGDNTTSSLVHDFADVVDSVFNSNFDIASLWVWRLSTAAGVAIGSSCDTRRSTNILKSTYTGNAARVVQAHEIGHNLGAFHDTDCCHVMYPTAIPSATTWSDRSQGSINRKLERCFYNNICDGYPVPEVHVEILEECVPGLVLFADSSNVDTRCWYFEDGTAMYHDSNNILVDYLGQTFNADVILEVTDSLGRSSRRRTSVSIVGDPDATMFPGEGGWDYPSVSFSSACFGSSFWDFGNGDTTTSMYPYYTYDAPGIYTVTHICENMCGIDTAQMVLDFSMSSIQSNESSSGLSVIYPNPASTYVIIEHNVSLPYIFQMTDVQGRFIQINQTVLSEREYIIRFPEPIADGVYFIRGTSSELSFSKMLFVDSGY